ncbi:hypothetical protein HMPREF9413_4023 [Paenibacillus sp. HGF7]|nr:hypothetical protein HMPREF9413_4023 [Paenibacillus sp. HGF7]
MCGRTNPPADSATGQTGPTVARTVTASDKSFGACPYRLSSVCKPPICYRGLFHV